jgi:sigma-B regulation protein RsbU (phosphoserine phosphatase)
LTPPDLAAAASAPQRLVLASDVASIGQASDWLRSLAVGTGLGDDDVYRLDLCTGELLNNIVAHAYEGLRGKVIELRAWPMADEIQVDIVDDGLPFDPVAHRSVKPAPCLDDPRGDGWGLMLLQRFADDCRYQRRGEQNVVTLHVRRRAEVPPLDDAAPRGPERRRHVGPVIFPIARADGTVVQAEARSGIDRRVLGFISRFDIFRGVPYALVEHAVAQCRILRFADGTVLLKPGERNDSIAFVLSGRLRVHFDAPDSANFLAIDAGNCAGEMSVIDGKPVSAYVVADAGCRVLLMDSRTLFERLLCIPEVSRSFMTVLTDRVRSTSQRMMDQVRANLAHEQFQRDLRLAHDIQLGMLPHASPLLPGRSDVECDAAIRVARQIGGDFYDAFFIDRTRLFVMIGDVCGKGLSAALFMVRAMTMLRAEAATGVHEPRRHLERMLGRVNALLIERNDASLFVTAFCAVLDTRDGTFSYVNAGHCPPALALGGGGFAPLAEPRNPVAGIIDGLDYAGGEIVLPPGSAVVIYTDGVTEANDAAMQEFGAPRMLAALDRSPRDAAALVRTLVDAVEAFAGAAPQSDDLALLALRYLGPAADVRTGAARA